MFVINAVEDGILFLASAPNVEKLIEKSESFILHLLDGDDSSPDGVAKVHYLHADGQEEWVATYLMDGEEPLSHFLDRLQNEAAKKKS